jgi:hypothetical protein
MAHVFRIIFLFFSLTITHISYAETVTQPAILTYSLLGDIYNCGSSTQEPPSGLLVCYMAGYRAQYPDGNFHSEYLSDTCARTNTSSSCTLHFTQTTTFDAQRSYTINKVYSCDTGGTLFATTPKTCQYTVPSCTPPQILNPARTACVAPPCPVDEGNMGGALYSGSCIGGCEKQWNGQYFDMSGTRYYGYLGNTGTACSISAQGSSNPTSMQDAFDAAKAAAAAQEAADKAAADAAAKDAADAKTAADKAAAAAAAEAAATAKKAADDAAKKAEESAAKAAATAASESATQAEKDAAAAQASADAAAAAAAASAAATAAGQAAAAAKDDTPPETKDFCETNPKSFICKNSSITTGTCYNGKPNGFNCDSDAVLCAIAKTQIDSFCFNSQQDNALIDSYNAMKNDNGSSSPAHSSNITTINLPSSLDASSPYSGQCNPDLTVSFNGDSVTLPFSQWCGILEALGYLFLASAYISAAYIIGGKT